MILKALGTLPAVYLQHRERPEPACSEVEGLGVNASSRPAAPDWRPMDDAVGLCQSLKGLAPVQQYSCMTEGRLE